MKNAALIFLSTVLFFCTAKAQSQQQILKWMNTVKADNHDFYYEIPFEYVNDQIVIKVTIGTETYKYIFDTGAYNDITDEIQAKNNFPVLTTQTVGSSNKIKAKVNMVKVDSLKIGPLVFRDIAALQLNLKNSPTINCTINGALVGASLIKNYAWQIDYPHKKIIVTDQPNKLPGINDAVKIPVTFNSRLMPFINVKINGKTEKLLFDLGSSALFILSEKAAEKYTNKKPVIEVVGGSSEGGNGVLQQDMQVFKADSIEISSIKLKNKPIVDMPFISESLIGNPVIKNYIVILDFKDNALYLAPVKDAATEQGWSTFGFRMNYVHGKVMVISLYRGLAADNAGLMINDEILAVNGQKLSYPDECAAIASLPALLNLKTELSLTILRNGIKKEIKIARQRVF